MEYLSIDIQNISQLYPMSTEGEYIRSVRINNILWINYNKYGNWITDNLLFMMTEKINAILCMRFQHCKAIQKYNISKFLLTSYMVKNYLVSDILIIIVTLSD